MAWWAGTNSLGQWQDDAEYLSRTFAIVPEPWWLGLLILLAIILLFFGAKRVPELGRSLGSGIREFRKGTAGPAGDGKEELEERKQKDEEEPSLNGVAHAESSYAEAEATTHTEHKP